MLQLFLVRDGSEGGPGSGTLFVLNSLLHEQVMEASSPPCHKKIVPGQVHWCQSFSWDLILRKFLRESNRGENDWNILETNGISAAKQALES